MVDKVDSEKDRALTNGWTAQQKKVLKLEMKRHYSWPHTRKQSWQVWHVTC